MTKINGRTPEEIKNGLEYCISESVLSCDECPYAGKPCDSMQMLKDAIAYIQQLECERDAAVEALRGNCLYCANFVPLGFIKCTKLGTCKHMPNGGTVDEWQWRGVQEVERQ